MITSGTGLHLVAKRLQPCSSTSYPSGEDYEERTRLSPSAAYLTIQLSMEHTKVTSSLDTTFMSSITTLALLKGSRCQLEGGNSRTLKIHKLFRSY
jgi:hypothetical protein